ncbi:MAG: DUF2066 domain-containing protein [Methyloprofundus sp.]|nr:DUF2066 domain-containing protein [Methyloprofundus sp.]
MKLYTRLLVVYLVLAAQYVAAVEIKGLYETEVTVPSQSREDRNIAIREALVNVFNRVGASQEMMQDPGIRDALNNAAAYVNQYQYILAADDSAASSAHKMRVSFAESALVALIRSRGLAVWGKMRDNVLLWLVIKQQGRQVLLNVEQNAEINKALQFATQLKGIPVLLPLMDLEERRQVSVDDVGSADWEKLLLASRRYGVAAVLSGKLVRQRTCWRSEWTLSFNHKLEQWRVPCENLNANLSTAFQGVYKRLFDFYAVKPINVVNGTVMEGER